MGKNSGIPYEEIYNEQWRIIEGWPLYHISDLGRVRHLYNNSLWIVNPSRQPYHKWYVVLSMDNVRWTVMVDRLVIESFSPEPRRGRKIIHLDHNLDNNALDNLKYASKAEYRRWFREHYKLLGKTKNADRIAAERAAAAKRRKERTKNHTYAAQRWFYKELTLKEAAASIGITESALSVWIKRHGLNKSQA